jgi:hypothetical protein
VVIVGSLLIRGSLSTLPFITLVYTSSIQKISCAAHQSVVAVVVWKHRLAPMPEHSMLRWLLVVTCLLLVADQVQKGWHVFNNTAVNLDLHFSVGCLLDA